MTGAATGVLSAQQIELTSGATTNTRSYVLSVPDVYDANEPYPLVFAWHGLGGSGTGARQYFRIEQQAGGQAIFVYPSALPLESQGGQPAWDLSPTGIDAAFFDALLADLSQKYCINQSRVFSTGHSWGGFFTNRLGCSRGNVLRAVAPVAGGRPFGGGGACNPPAIPAWIAHGSNDMTVLIPTGEGSRDLWTEANTCDATTQPTTPEPCVAYDGCDSSVHWCLHDQGHNWPTFAAAGIWAFFDSFR
jgi:poly(3-hydroxybutyrate) depolymerase